MSRKAFVTLLIAMIAAIGIAFSALPVLAADPEPTVEDTARLLGYMWGDGAETNGEWQLTGPSGASSLIEELVVIHGGTWINRSNLHFTLPAPYNWSDWKDGLPDNSADVRAAVENPHFLAALIETEGSTFGQIYDQSRCCVPGFTRGRLTELRDLLVRSGYQTTQFTQFNNVDSGRVDIGEAEFAELRSNLEFVCPVSDAAIRVPGGTQYGQYGNISWIDAGSPWADVVRTSCSAGQSVPAPTAPVGTCSVRADGSNAVVEWTFSVGDANIRRDDRFIVNAAIRDGSWSESLAAGTYSYEIRAVAFGQQSTANCGSVTIGAGAPAPAPTPAPAPAPAPPVDGTPCILEPAIDDQVLLSWDNFGENTYFVRKNNRWAQTVPGQLITLASGSLQDVWEIRYFEQGSAVDIPCTSGGGGGAPAPVAPPCTVSFAGGAQISWDAVDGQASYQVRRNGRWIATVHNNTVSYVDAAGSANDSYVIRYWRNGSPTDIACV